MILYGIMIGLFIGMPVGAIGMMTIQRTLKYGFRAGLLTGFGSSVADCIYASVGTFGLTFVSDFFIRYKMWINIFGSILVMILGLRMILNKEETTELQKNAMGSISLFFSSFAIGITNPVVIVTFMFIFSYLGISLKVGLFKEIVLIIGVFIGTYIWWLLLSSVVSMIRKKINFNNFYKINRIFGTILILFGVVILVKMLI